MSNAKNELELKYQLSEEALSIYEEKVRKAGFVSGGECLETDITVDLPNFESKSKGIVIRYRIISVGRYLLTIKLKRQNNHYQEYVELEYSSNSNDNLAFSDIQCLLQKELDVVLPRIVLEGKDVSENCIYLINQLYDLGFTRCRMFSQKKRHEYKKENTGVCFDLFPSHVGAFIELEAFSEEKLIALKELMALPEHCRISKNYGKIIQDSLKKQGLDSDRSRICLFDETLRQFAYKKFHS
ncbi:CYTH domain-containing protein [Streptococcus vicugnae]|uniref:CYTH domain-containing protein n=1 Tax=Streptococcus vicugnae TaxID=2740579 RepID=UPI001FE4A91E|nr:CYTH domain-containing protein [Streptococcus vicugnae]